VRQALQGNGVDYDSAEVTFVPSVTVELDLEDAQRLFKLIEAIEECDDVQNVYSNFDVSDEVLAQVG